MVDRWWLEQCVSANPLQPATALWRAVELDTLSRTCQALSLTRTTRMLDLGCGDGSTMQLLAARIPKLGRVVGIDRDPREAKLAQATGVYDAVLVCDAAQVPSPDEAYDVIISNSVLEHIPVPYVTLVFRELGRLVRRSGYVVLTVPSPGFHVLLRGPRILRWFGYSRARYLRYIDRRLQHHYYWNAAQWHDQLAGVGLRLVQSIEYLDVREVRRWELLSNMTAGTLYRLGGVSRHPLNLLYALRVRKTTYPRAVSRLAWLFMDLFARDLTRRVGSTPPYGCLLLSFQKAAA